MERTATSRPTAPESAPDEPAGALRSVALTAIEPNPRQPRRRFSDAQLAALAQSLAAQGVIQPLVVRPHPSQPGRYQLVAGERRWRAARRLGWRSVPALVRDVPDEALLETALVENLQREQLTPIEEATAYRTLIDHYGYTQESLAARAGKDRSTIANMVRLLALPPLLQGDLEEGRLTTGHARALLGLAHPDAQLACREVVLRRGLSVRETEQLVQRERRHSRHPAASGEGTEDSSAPGSSEPAAPAVPPAEALQFQAVQEMLERRLATRVTIQPSGKGGAGAGRIEIEYYSLDDFNRLYELLVR